ncbi:MAG: carboxypeptidase-like regulatory domain-containing protein [Acidobacteriota bacterium]
MCTLSSAGANCGRTATALLALAATLTHAQLPAPPLDARTAPAQQRIPQQRTAPTGALQGILYDEQGRPLPAVRIQLLTASNSTNWEARSEGDGIFRLLKIQPGTYDLLFTPTNGAATFRRNSIVINPGEVLSIEVHLTGFHNAASPNALPQSPQETTTTSTYTELNRRPDADGAVVVPQELPLPADSLLFQPRPDRWNAEMPDYHRYPSMETPFVMGHWYDPFNRNRLKGDKPLFGRTFFSFTGDSITAIDARRLPVNTGQSTPRPNDPGFFGDGGQFFLAQTFRATADLFHGDTAAFRPVDWRIRITAAANLNDLRVRENKIVSPNVLDGTTRFDTRISLQEAFGEVKLADVGPNYDFINLRAGIQQFVSDFRGFIFADEQPGVRLFGNLRSNRFQWNVAAFDLLEKNTNSGLNTFARRGREVALANLYVQDFLAQGYTTQLSYHFVRDDGDTHYDDNGFLVRPAPIGLVQRHRIDAHYLGWTGDGHIGRYDITHAFYQAFGTDTLNQIAGRATSINAQLAAVELSRDYDWLRFRASALYASGDNDPRNGQARGFSSIVDGEAFAGGEFSFFNREGIRLTGTGVALTANDSFLPDLRSSKDEGQSNFVNPGIQLFNAGADAKLLPTLKLIGNVSFLQFARTQPLVFLLQQNAIRRTIGTDASLGVIYRPFLSDNIISGGAAALVPSSGLRDIYTSQTLFSLFTTVRFQF